MKNQKLIFAFLLCMCMCLFMALGTACEEDACKHNYQMETVLEATCETEGAFSGTCTICGKTDTVIIPALGHDIQTHPAKAPNCGDIGWEAYETCSRCDYTTYKEIPAPGVHIWNDGEPTIPASCTTKGEMVYTCTLCLTTKTEILDTLEHSFKEYISNNDATCLHNGTKTASCSYGCGKTNTVEDVGSALGHDIQTHPAQAPTCVDVGWEEYETCNRCDYTTYKGIPALGEHKWDDGEVIMSASCLTEGEMLFYCVFCRETKIERTAKLDHCFENYISNGDATCVQDGTKTAQCSYGCHKKDTVVDVGSALGHDIQTHPAKAPNCGNSGWETYETCSRCNYTTYKIIPATGQHSWNNGVVTLSASCLTNGEKTFACTVCGSSYFEQIAALGHDIQTHPAKDPNCGDIGWEAYETCSRCDYTTYKEIPATGQHSWDKGKLTKQPTCTAEGEKTITCTFCSATKTEPISMLPHNYSIEWFSNEEYHFHQCQCGAIDYKEQHQPSEPATATTSQVCTTCGRTLQDKTGLLFKTFECYSNIVNGSVSNATQTFSFEQEITVVGNAMYLVSLDEQGTQIVADKVVSLKERNNQFWVLETLNDNIVRTYTVNIYRRIMCLVTFDTQGGTEVPSQWVEEGTRITEPITQKQGYVLSGWSYDFSRSIYRNTTITALWTESSDIPYKVNHFLQNIDDDDYTFYQTVDCKGTTSYQVSAKLLTLDHFTFNSRMGNYTGTVTSDGSLVLNVYYTRNTYVLSVYGGYGTITNAGTYKYGTKIETMASVPRLDIRFKGWYSGNELLSAVPKCTFLIERNIYAEFELISELQIFNYYADETTCVINGLKDVTATTVAIPDCVTSIEYRAFFNCGSLTSITIPDSVILIDDYAFSGCNSLESIRIGNSVTSIGDYAFSDCKLEDITIPDSVTNFGLAFQGCSSLKSINIGNSVTSIEYRAFFNCGSLTSITIPDSVILIDDYAFNGCNSLESIRIGNSVTSIGDYAFSDCKLEDITIPDSVTNFGLAFRGCSSLKSINIGNSVTSIANDAFGGCGSLASVIFGNSVTSIGERAFICCRKLTSVTISNSVTNIGYKAFAECNSLINVVPRNSSTTVNIATNVGNSAFYNCSSLKSISTLKNLNVGDNAFENCENLTSVAIGHSITSIGDKAFFCCRSLASITIGNSVTSIGDQAFYGCSGLSSIMIPNSVTSIGHSAFYGCSGLKNIAIGNSVTSIGDYAFSGCSALANITIPDSVTNIGNGSFFDCSGLTSITIGNSVTSIGHSAFSGCSGLSSIMIPNSVTSIADSAFCACSSLSNISVNANNTHYISIDGNLYTKDKKTLINYATGREATEFVIPDSVTGIGSYAFYGCRGLTSITIPNSVTSIGAYAFYGCRGLTSITIPNSVTSIGAYAFAYCSGLTKITMSNSVTSIGSRAFNGCDNLRYNVYNNANYLGNNENPYAVLVSATSKSITTCELNENTKVIYFYAFNNCSNLESIVIPDSVIYIGESVFSGCSSLTSITIPNSATLIGGSVFNGCDNLRYNVYNNANYLGNNENPYAVLVSATSKSITTCELNENTKVIYFYAFNNCSNLESIVIPDSVTSIGDHAITACNSLKNVYYKGTAEEWANISIDNYTNSLGMGVLYYYSETQPTTDGNYWHYNANNEIVVWTKE